MILYNWFSVLRRQRRPKNISSSEYDLAAINTRLYRAMYLLGRTRVELAEHFGIDTSIPLCEQPKLPEASTENIIKAANFLGVSFTWLLTGEPCTEVDHYVRDADNRSAGSAAAAMAANTGHNSAVVQGSQNTSVVVKHYHTDLTEFEQELLLRYRSLDAQKQVAVLERLFELNAQAQERDGAEHTHGIN